MSSGNLSAAAAAAGANEFSQGPYPELNDDPLIHDQERQPPNNPYGAGGPSMQVSPNLSANQMPATGKQPLIGEEEPIPGLPADDPVAHEQPNDPALMYGEPVYVDGVVNAP